MKRLLAIVLVLAMAVVSLSSCSGGGGGGQSGNTLSKDDIVIMLGNSITRRGDWSGLFPNNTFLNYGIDGAETSQILSRLSAALSRNPKVLCIMGGINDFIHGLSVSTAYNNLRQIVIRSKAAGVIVIVQATLYTGADYPNSTRINPKVTELNHMLNGLATAEGQTWLDLNSTMAENSTLKVQYLLTDNLHLNSDGYAEWADRLNSALP
ncbi:MAG: hypothetical protein K9K66_13140 [Desulfarculaceae bacterium]|nr:hypothetical protein [Desulfarculaceae bacterium]MCF8072717.1 hypothetical protein [Desulfarculaceae bacterium]MCF8102596.1 hypothetical protein [Desulfarculaceae bacterium]MCF8116505.1 hypothetical protein [Desulfarculaceae bacterium]